MEDVVLLCKCPQSAAEQVGEAKDALMGWFAARGVSFPVLWCQPSKADGQIDPLNRSPTKRSQILRQQATRPSSRVVSAANSSTSLDGQYQPPSLLPLTLDDVRRMLTTSSPYSTRPSSHPSCVHYQRQGPIRRHLAQQPLYDAPCGAQERRISRSRVFDHGRQQVAHLGHRAQHGQHVAAPSLAARLKVVHFWWRSAIHVGHLGRLFRRPPGRAQEAAVARRLGIYVLGLGPPDAFLGQRAW